VEKREYVDVVSVEVANSSIPHEIIWRDKSRFIISRLIHTCICLDNGKEVQRHTVLIGSKQKYLYKDNNTWYVKIPG